MKLLHLRLLSPLSPEECCERISAITEIGTFLPSVFGSKQLVGIVSADRLFLRKRIGYRNSFQPRLNAVIRPTKKGTIIYGEIEGLTSGIMSMFPIYLGFILVFCVLGVTFSLRGNGWLFPVAITVWYASMICVSRVGDLWSQNEPQYITSLLMDNLNASALTKEEMDSLIG